MSEAAMCREYMSLESPDMDVAQYQLYGISNHSGSTDGGHYIAHCKNFDDGYWYCLLCALCARPHTH